MEKYDDVCFVSEAKSGMDEWDIYNDSVLSQKLYHDEIDPYEEAFTRGYIESYDKDF